MKGVFVILDGVADLPTSALNQQTPLEVAKTPNLDEIAKKSRIDHCYTVKENVAPQSSSAVISLFGHDSTLVPRGPLEAQGAGIKLTNGDLALRTNFATIDNLEDLNLLDRRAGRTLTTKESKILARAINEKVKLPVKFEFHSTIQHRGVLVFRGGFSDNITNIDPSYGVGIVSNNSNEKVKLSLPMDDEDDSKFSADVLNKFFKQSFKILDAHNINLSRARKGLFSANAILCRDAGNKPIKLKKPKGSWMALGYMPLEIGIAKSMKFGIYKFNYPKLKKMDVYSNLYQGLEKAIKNSIKMLKKYNKKYDYFYIHFKETDTPGHDNKPFDKIKMIEILDKKFFSVIKRFCANSKIVLTADHTTACKLKSHTSDPVPVMVYSPENESSEKRFTEARGLKGKKFLGRKLLEQTLFKK
ncbi:phosphoglycerate mutase [Candidatus Pacearchaeota archaeon]|nr:phosphoglycerate mutase [Candidatus Pacearchaeota archaeon]